jgi:hypothetical protein
MGLPPWLAVPVGGLAVVRQGCFDSEGFDNARLCHLHGLAPTISLQVSGAYASQQCWRRVSSVVNPMSILAVKPSKLPPVFVVVLQVIWFACAPIQRWRLRHIPGPVG